MKHDTTTPAIVSDAVKGSNVDGAVPVRAKSGWAAMTLPMARDMAKLGVHIMAISPGVFLTPMVSGMSKEVQDALAQICEFPKRLGRPNEFARLVETIATNTMLNGEVIRLDAGTRMQAK